MGGALGEGEVDRKLVVRMTLTVRTCRGRRREGGLLRRPVMRSRLANVNWTSKGTCSGEARCNRPLVEQSRRLPRDRRG